MKKFQEIRNWLGDLCLPGHVYELRCPKPLATSGYFDDLDKLAENAEQLSEHVEAVYVTLNPVDPSLLARCQNRCKNRCKEATSDKDVLKRGWLLVDVDAVRPPGISSTDAEHEAALVRTKECRTWLATHGFPEPVFADSGNGGHLLYRIDLPNDPETITLIKGVLVALGRQFPEDKVSPKLKVDQTVFNPSRISKLYGTKVCKGDSTADRPHRYARILERPQAIQVTPKEVIQKLVVKNSEGVGGLKDVLAGVEKRLSPQAVVKYTVEEVEDLLARHDIEVNLCSEYNSGKRWRLEECPFNPSHANAAVFLSETGTPSFSCFHDSCSAKEWPQFLEHFDEPAERQQPQPGQPAAPVLPVEPDAAKDRRRRGYRLADLMDLEPQQWQVANHFHIGGMVCLYGPPGSYKSFIALDMALAVATGKPYLGVYDVVKGPVVYICSEGKFGIRPRLHAWMKQRGVPTFPQDMIVIPDTFNLLDPEEKNSLYEIIVTDLGVVPTLVVIDTLARNFGTGDENAAKDMNAFVNTVTAIGKKTEATMLVVHHTGKTKEFERGHTSLRGAADTMICVKKSKDDALISCDKQKDAAEFEAYLAYPQIVDLGGDLDSLVMAGADIMRTRFQLLKREAKETLVSLAGHFSYKAFTQAEGQAATGQTPTTFKRNWKYLKEKDFLLPHHEKNKWLLSSVALSKVPALGIGG